MKHAIYKQTCYSALYINDDVTSSTVSAVKSKISYYYNGCQRVVNVLYSTTTPPPRSSNPIPLPSLYPTYMCNFCGLVMCDSALNSKYPTSPHLPHILSPSPTLSATPASLTLSPSRPSIPPTCITSVASSCVIAPSSLRSYNLNARDSF